MREPGHKTVRLVALLRRCVRTERAVATGRPCATVGTGTAVLRPAARLLCATEHILSDDTEWQNVLPVLLPLGSF